MLLAAKLSGTSWRALRLGSRRRSPKSAKSISINSSDFSEGKRPRQNRNRVGGGHFRSAGIDYCATGERRHTEHPQVHPTHGGARRKKGVQTGTHSATCRGNRRAGQDACSGTTKSATPDFAGSSARLERDPPRVASFRQVSSRVSQQRILACRRRTYARSP